MSKLSPDSKAPIGDGLLTPVSTPSRKPQTPGSGGIKTGYSATSADTYLTTASTLSPLLKSKGGSRFGIGHFIIKGDKIVFQKKSFPVTTKEEDIKCLFKIGVEASEASRNLFNLPRNIIDQFQKYIDYLISGKILVKTPLATSSDSSSGGSSDSSSSRSPSPPHSPTLDIAFSADFAILLDVDLSDRSEVLQNFIKEIKILFEGYEKRMHKVIELSSYCRDQEVMGVNLVQVLASRIVSESESLLARFYVIFNDSSSKFNTEIKKLKGANEVVMRRKLGTEYESKLLKLENDLKNFDSVGEKIDDILGSGRIFPSLDFPAFPLTAKLNDGRFCSYDLNIGDDGFVFPCFTIEGSSRRPEIRDKKGDITQTQGNHTTAYALLLQVFLNSIPSLSRYEDLPKKIEAILILSFQDSEKEAWKEFVKKDITNRFNGQLISDKKRREFIERSTLEKESKDSLNNIIKLYQIEICCEIICLMTDKYLFISNQSDMATVPIKPGAAQNGGGEGLLIKNFSEAALYCSSNNYLKLVQEELEALRKKSENKQRIENLEKLERILSRDFSKSFKKIPTIFSSKNNAEKTISETLAGLIDLSSMKESVNNPSLDVLLFENLLRNYFLRHFRISSSVISPVIDWIDKIEKGRIYNYKDSFNSVVSQFFDCFSQKNEFLKKYVDDIRFSIVDEGGVLNLDSTDPLSKTVVKTDFTSFLENILRNAVKIYHDNYLTTKEVGGFGFISPLTADNTGFALSSPSLVSPQAFMLFSTPVRSLPSLDVFDHVGPTSNLTHQNIEYLLKEAFTSERFGYDVIYDEFIYEELVKIGAISIVTIDAVGDSLERYLRDNILKFIGSGLDRASIALCRGGSIESGETDVHWSALHLRKVKLSEDSYDINAYYTDSMGGDVPSVVMRVLGSLASITEITSVNYDLKHRILLELRKFNSFNRIIIPVAIQENAWSCGYHAVLALRKMHQADYISASNLVSEEEAGIFIENAQEFFSKRVGEAASGNSVEGDKQIEVYKPLFDRLRKKDKTLIFVLIDSKMSHEKSIINDRVEKAKIFECRGRAGYRRAVDKIKEEIATQTEEFNLHLILFAHGKGNRIISLGEDFLPENIFKEFSAIDGLTVSSVVSCGSGFEVEKISGLNAGQIMIIRAGKRETLRVDDISRIIDVIDSRDVVPRLLKKVASKIILLPPETIKIVAQGGVYKFSPFDIFKKSDALSREEIFEAIKKQQISLMQLFGISKGEIEEIQAFKMEDLELKEMEKYLIDLAFLVVATKDDRKVQYLRNLLNLGVSLESQRIFEGIESQHLIAEVCLSGNIEMLELLLAKKPDLINFSTESKKDLLIIACIGGKVALFYHLVVNKGLDIATKDGEDNNIFHHIIANGNIELLNFVLSEIADSKDFIKEKLSERNHNGRTPFDEAAALNNLELMEISLELGFGFSNDLIEGRELLIAAHDKGLNRLVDYFIKNNICWNEEKDGSNIFHILAKEQSSKNLDLALKIISKNSHEASILLAEEDDHGRTPLDIAKDCDNHEMVKLLTGATLPGFGSVSFPSLSSSALGRRSPSLG
jgi:ankyrin repeat protein